MEIHSAIYQGRPHAHTHIQIYRITFVESFDVGVCDSSIERRETKITIKKILNEWLLSPSERKKKKSIKR